VLRKNKQHRKWSSSL